MYILISLILKKYFPRDIVRLILIHLYPFKFQTWWLRNERNNMLKEYKENFKKKEKEKEICIWKYKDIFEEILENTEKCNEFLDQYRHESGSYYKDVYDCSYYIGCDEDCNCGGTMSAFWCDYQHWGVNWHIEHHMDNDGHLSALQISNNYFSEYREYQERKIERRSIRKKIPKIKFPRRN